MHHNVTDVFSFKTKLFASFQTFAGHYPVLLQHQLVSICRKMTQHGVNFIFSTPIVFAV